MHDVMLAAGISTGKTSAGIIAYIIIGGLAGWIASKFMGTDAQMGIVLNIVVGVVGAILGGFILGKVFGLYVEGGGWFFTFLIALIGAVILLAIAKLFMGRGARR